MAAPKLSDLDVIRQKIATTKGAIVSGKNRRLTAEEIERHVNERIDSFVSLFDIHHAAGGAARGQLNPEDIAQCTFAGLSADAKLGVTIAWMAPDTLKTRLIEAAMLYAEKSPEADIAGLEKELYSLETEEERLFCALESAGKNPGYRRPDVDPSIVLGL